MRACSLGKFGVLSLLMLRLVVGWHFFKEGAKKLQDPEFSSKFFLQEATGPLASRYHNLVPDRYGREMLDDERRIARWTNFQKSFSVAARWDTATTKRAEKILADQIATLKEYYRSRAADLTELQADIQRMEGLDASARSGEVEFESAWRKKRWKELQGDLTSWSKELTAMDQALETGLRELLPTDNKGTPAPSLKHGGKTWVDASVTWLTLLVGACLMLGCCVPLASLAGCLFLLSVMASQPFWVPDAVTTYSYYQAVEIAALLVLAGTCAGRFAGFDYFLSIWWSRFREGGHGDHYGPAS